MVKDFKFFESENKDRVFTDWMDQMDDYHLGGITHRTERPDAIHIGEIMGELISSIQVLNEQVRNNS
jgi:hypothetical protein